MQQSALVNSASRGGADLIGRLAGAMRRARPAQAGIAVHLAVSPEAFAAHIAAHVRAAASSMVRPKYAAVSSRTSLEMDVDYVLVDATTVRRRRQRC